MITLRPVSGPDAEALFPLIYHSEVADSIQWDGPDSLDTFRQTLAERAKQVDQGQRHMFTIIETGSGCPVGNSDIRPDPGNFRADIGL